jgi:hypothetical protein
MASFMSLVFCLSLSEAKRLVGQIGLWPEMHPHEVSYNASTTQSAPPQDWPPFETLSNRSAKSL